MSSEEAWRRDMEAQNARMRAQIDEMLADLQKRTAELQEKQAEAAQRKHEVKSEDGKVTATVDASGTLEQLKFSEDAFEEMTPEKLGTIALSVIREATGTARVAVQDEFEPLTENVPDFSDLMPGMPSVKDYIDTDPLISGPDPEEERAKRSQFYPQSQRSAPKRNDDDDSDSFLVGPGY